jgi:hypothetical protein
MAARNKATFPVSEQTARAATDEGGGYGWQYVPRAIRPDTPIRQKPAIQVADIEAQPMKYIALALVHLRNQIAALANMAEDRGRPIDEYQPQEILGELESTITVQPQWETSERITSVLITGPPGNVTVQLGDRIWPLTIPASGFLLIAPISIFLGRSDSRILTAATPGQYSLELSGYCDTRGQLL